MPSAVRALRGATTLDVDEKDHLFERVIALLDALFERNDLAPRRPHQRAVHRHRRHPLGVPGPRGPQVRARRRAADLRPRARHRRRHAPVHPGDDPPAVRPARGRSSTTSTSRARATCATTCRPDGRSRRDRRTRAWARRARAGRRGRHRADRGVDRPAAAAQRLARDRPRPRRRSASTRPWPSGRSTPSATTPTADVTFVATPVHAVADEARRALGHHAAAWSPTSAG